MAIQSQDAYGPYIDTGVGTVPTQRASVEVEVHQPNEIDSGSKLTPNVQLPPSHQPHRPAKSPR